MLDGMKPTRSVSRRQVLTFSPPGEPPEGPRVWRGRWGGRTSGAACDALLELIELARSISELGSGAFDITIQPVLAVYRRALAESGVLPSSSVIEEALALAQRRLCQ